MGRSRTKGAQSSKKKRANLRKRNRNCSSTQNNNSHQKQAIDQQIIKYPAQIESNNVTSLNPVVVLVANRAESLNVIGQGFVPVTTVNPVVVLVKLPPTLAPSGNTAPSQSGQTVSTLYQTLADDLNDTARTAPVTSEPSIDPRSSPLIDSVNLSSLVTTPKRNKHAIIPHKATYKKAILQNNQTETIAAHHIGPMNDVCVNCGALFFQCEPKNRNNQRQKCCNFGEIDLPCLHDCPESLKKLLTERTPAAYEFRNNIRVANSLFAMASFKTNVPQNRHVGQGHWCFHVYGQIYHYTEALPTTRKEHNQPRLNQYYFIDAADAIDKRVKFLEGRIRPETVAVLENMLRAENCFIQSYMAMSEVMAERNKNNETVSNIVLAFKENMQQALRSHNLPESRSDIAAIFDSEGPPFNVDLKIFPKDASNSLREIKNLNKMADPMVYPLLFPCGEYGFDCELRYRTKPSKKITMREFYRYRLQLRRGFSIIHHGGKLFQQYIVDAWCRVESNDLWWYRMNQSKLRTANRPQILRMLEQRARKENLQVGNITILPPCFIGGPRNQSRKYLDAMTVVSRLGKPDLFITFTCNPNWPEIHDNLHGQQKWENRPDLLVRVFHAKLLEFLDDISQKQLYGVCLTWMYVIEFQKRGLPHAHILVTLRSEDKLDSVEKIDQVVCASLPDPQDEPTLFNTVTQCNIHRPCGSENPNANCMQNGECSKKYPKNFAQYTTLNSKLGLPTYKRPNDGRHIMMHGVRVDNRYVIPYNRFATMKYRCHCNFEICGSIASIKYLHKYVYKRADSINIQTGKNTNNIIKWDEIGNYVDCRHVSSVEGVWRLFEFKMRDRMHSVLVLPVHLPDEQQVQFNDTDDVEHIQMAADKTTKLMAWFKLNAQDPLARNYKYHKIPEHYTWNDKDSEWGRRVQISRMFGCIAEVSPNDTERFYLRMLLSHIQGATSFEELKTVNGYVCDTFQDACQRRNLLKNLDEYDRCLKEASSNRSAKGLRRLFILICTAGEAFVRPQIPKLYERYRSQFCEDFINKGHNETTAEALALAEMAEMLNRTNERTLSQMGLPSFNVNLLDEIRENDHVAIPSLQRELIDTLNIDQRKIFDAVMTAVDNYINGMPNVNNVFFVDGPGGSGKTYLYNIILQQIQCLYNRHTIAVAWTGIAATLLKGGRTVHRAFKLPLNVQELSKAGFPVEHPKSKVIRHAVIIVWDEAPMTPKMAVHSIDRYLRDLMNTPNTLMGGKVVVFGGDFRQVLPVVPLGVKNDVIQACLKTSRIWPAIKQFHLQQNLRAGAQEIEFSKWLLQLGDGRVPHVKINSPDITIPNDLIEIPQCCVVQTKEELVQNIYNGQSSLADIAILCPTNACVDEINKFILDEMKEPQSVYYSVDDYENDEDDKLHIPIDLLHSIKVASLPPHELCLKTGAVVMLTKNLDIDMGQCNGTRCKILKMGEHFIEVEIQTGTHLGDIILLPRIEMSAQDSMLPKPIKRFQFPIKLAFAMTINKSQGQTFSKVGVYLENPCFSHGQLYVAFSRVGRLENIKIFISNHSTQHGSFKFPQVRKFTRNVVYKSVLGDGTDMAYQVESSEPKVNLEDDIADEELSRRIETMLEDDYVKKHGVKKISNLQTPLVTEPVIHFPKPYHKLNDNIPPPQRSDRELRARISVAERAGMSGAYFDNVKRPRVTYSDDDDDSD